MSESIKYETAKRKLDAFLKNRSLPSKVAWVFFEDLVWVNGALRVRSRIPPENEPAVRAAIESKRAQELGVELRVVANTADMTLCAAIVPANKREAEELMISGLKLSVPEGVLQALEVVSAEEWTSLRLRHREPSPFAGLPRRGT